MSIIINSLQTIWHTVRANWGNALATHVLGTLIAYVVLAPLASLLLNIAVSLSGNTALSDQEILFFVLTPFGLASLVVLGAIAITVIAFKHAALMTIIEASYRGQHISYVDALLFISRRSLQILLLGMMMVAKVLLYVLPLLGISWLAFGVFMAEHDINYYLTDKPPEYWYTVVIVGGMALGTAVLLLKMLAGWVYSLPLILFNGRGAKSALELSQQTAVGYKRPIVGWMLAWILLDTLLFAAAVAMMVWLGTQLLPALVESMQLMALGLGTVLLTGAALALLATFASAVLFSAIVLLLYRDAGLQGGRAERATAIDHSDKPPLARRWLVLGAAAALLVAIVSSSLLLDRLVRDDQSEVIAHRGASSAAPENTMAAIEEALAQGTDWVEIDVQESADGVIVVIHDRDLKKVGGVDMNVHNSTLEQLQSVDIGSWFAAEFSDQRIPTLEQILLACKGKAKVVIELKYYGHEQQLEQRVAEVVEATGMSQDVVAMSLSYEGISRMRALRPDWRVGLLTSVSAGNLDGLDLDFYAINAGFANGRFVRSAHRAKRKVMVWTINDVVGTSKMMSRRVDGIITDNPGLVRSVLEQRASLSGGERLLLELATLFGYQTRYLQQ
jgi:glycerophosphoryl diester phosphodiesterase